MSLAFGITLEDLESVLAKFGKLSLIDEEEIEIIFDALDFNLIEKAALYSTDMDEQIIFAYQEIENQLKENGIL
jgi:hypothetical protein